MWRVIVEQKVKYTHTDGYHNEAIEGEFNTSDEAIQFGKMVMSGFKMSKS